MQIANLWSNGSTPHSERSLTLHSPDGVDNGSIFAAIAFEKTYRGALPDIEYQTFPFHDHSSIGRDGTRVLVYAGGSDGGLLILQDGESTEDALCVTDDVRANLVSMSFDGIGQDAGPYRPTAYEGDSIYSGLFLGSVLWPYAVFVFATNNGSGKSLRVVSPASADGTRITLAELEVDWTSRFELGFVWRMDIQVIEVMYVGESGEITIQIKVDFATCAMLPAIKLGGYTVATGVGKASLIMGASGVDGSGWISYAYGIGTDAATYIRNGAVASDAVATLEAHTILELDGPWNRGSLTESTNFTMALTDTAPAQWLHTYDGIGAGWAVECLISLEDQSHPGAYNTGFGMLIENGDRPVYVSLLEQDDAHFIALAESPVVELASAAAYAACDWRGEQRIRISSMGDTLRMYIGDSLEIAAEAALSGSTEQKRVALGALTAGSIAGTLHVASMKFLLSGVVWEPGRPIPMDVHEIDGTIQDSGEALVMRRLTYLTSAAIPYTDAAAIFLRFSVDSWVDGVGRTETARIPFGPLLHIQVGAKSLQVMGIRREDGAEFIFIPGEDMTASASAVLAQSQEGVRRSASVDFSDMKVLLESRPGAGFFLTLGDETKVELPFSSNLSTPAEGLFGIAVGVGSPIQPIDMSIRWFYISTGLGLRLRAAVGEEDRGFGTDGVILIDGESL